MSCEEGGPLLEVWETAATGMATPVLSRPSVNNQPEGLQTVPETPQRNGKGYEMGKGLVSLLTERLHHVNEVMSLTYARYCSGLSVFALPPLLTILSFMSRTAGHSVVAWTMNLA